MSEELSSLKPQSIWKHFSEILKIPRCSGKEKAIGDYIINLAKNWNLEVLRDSVGNVLIRKPASPGRENAPGVILQAHLDMVCEKNSDVAHDFSKDAIKAFVDGDWVKARGTTLGADNGLGLATCLAILEDKTIAHGPLECLFTVDEETGLTGAVHLKKGFLKGKLLLNLDSEEEGTFTIGCAGGADSEIILPVERKKKKAKNALWLKITGLKGGHSGLDINLGRANAIKCLVRILSEVTGKFKVELISFMGGSKRNAIPREAEAVVAIDPSKQKAIINWLKKTFAQIQYEFRVTEPEMSLTVDKLTTSSYPLTSESQSKFLNLLLALPHGVVSMHPEIPGLVETSSNLAIVNSEDKAIKIICNSRSSVQSALEAIRQVIKAVSSLAGAKVWQPEGYPAWTPNLQSILLQRMIDIYKNLFNQEPEVKAVHAGLECGLIGEKYPGMDMISFGPTIKNPHSPDERVQISSVEKFWQLVIESLDKLS